MDCVTPSHPNKIPHGESLNIEQLLAKGDEAFLDPAIVPKDGPIELDKYPYTPRPTVLSTLNSSSDIRYLKAQITGDDNELKAIVREIEKENSPSISNSSGNGSDSGSGMPRGRRPKPKVPGPPPHAQPQRAVLMEVEDRWGMGYKKAFANANAHKPWLVPQKTSTVDSASAGFMKGWERDGWEV